MNEVERFVLLITTGLYPIGPSARRFVKSKKYYDYNKLERTHLLLQNGPHP